jgi:inosine-uridine nucleoside N-ribohydrolase
VVDIRGRTGKDPNANVAVDIEAQAFLELLTERVGSL